MAGNQFAKWLASPQAGALAQGLLAAGAPSTTPISFGQGMAMGMQNMQAAEEQEYKKKLMDMQLRKMGLEEQQFNQQLAQQQKAQAALEAVRNFKPDTSSELLQGNIASGTRDELAKALMPNFAPLAPSAQQGLLAQAQEFQVNPGLLEQAKQNTASQSQNAMQQKLADYYFAAGQPEKGFQAMGLTGGGGEGFTLSEGQTRFDARGKPVASVEKQKKAAELSPEQAKTATFADRAINANMALDELEKTGLDYAQQAKSLLPLGLGNYAISPEKQRLNRAQLDFLKAILRKESGANITVDEESTYGPVYFVQPGDSPEVMEDKRVAREFAIKGLTREAGPAYQPPTSVPTGVRATNEQVSAQNKVDPKKQQALQSMTDEQLQQAIMIEKYKDKINPALLQKYYKARR